MGNITMKETRNAEQMAEILKEKIWMAHLYNKPESVQQELRRDWKRLWKNIFIMQKRKKSNEQR